MTTPDNDWTYCGKCKKNLRTQVKRVTGNVDFVCIRCDFPERLPPVPGSQVDAGGTPD